MTNYIIINNDRREYEITYAVGEKVYKEKNCIVSTDQLVYDPGSNWFTYYCTRYFFGDCVSDNNDQQIAEIITTLPQLQQHLSVGNTVERELEYDGKKSFMKFLKSLEKSRTLKINDITQHSTLIIKVPKVVIGVGQKLNLDKLYDRYQINKLFKKYHNTEKQLIFKIPFDIQHKGEEKNGSGHIEYIGINHALIKTSTDHRGRRYQIGKTIEQLKIKKNYVVTEGHMFLTTRWTSYTVHPRKGEKIIYKDEEMLVRIDANGDVKVGDKYLKSYQEGKINIANGNSSVFIGDVPFADAVACGKWKDGIIRHNFAVASTYQTPFLSGWKPLSTDNVITTQPSSSIELANISTVADIHMQKR